MYSSETLTFMGRLSDLDNHNFNFNVIAIIGLIDFYPDEIKIYILGNDNQGLNLIETFPFRDEIVLIETESEEVKVRLEQRAVKNNFVFGKVAQLQIISAIRLIRKIKTEKE